MSDSYHSEVIRIPLVAGNAAAIRNAEFVDCQINGPAVLFPRGVGGFTNCSWDGTLDQIFWEIDPAREQVIGCVLVENCRFIDCRFSHIGLAGLPEDIANWRGGFAA